MGNRKERNSHDTLLIFKGEMKGYSTVMRLSVEEWMINNIFMLF